MKWLVTTGHGLKTHSAHNSLDDALRCVHEQIIRGKTFDSITFRATTGDDDGRSDGTLTGLSWDAPTREISRAEVRQKIASGQISLSCSKTWLRNRPHVTDWDRTVRCVTFIGDPVESVGICREDRYRQYLRRAGLCNDVKARVKEFEKLMASV